MPPKSVTRPNIKPTPFQRRERAKIKCAKEGSRSRGWLIIEFPRIRETAMKLETCNAEYFVYQEEFTRSWNRHLQGYVHYKSARSFASMKKQFPTACLIVANGSARQNKEYCQKEKSRIQNGLQGEGGALSDIFCLCTGYIDALLIELR